MKTAEDFIRPSALEQLAGCPGAAWQQACVANWMERVGIAPKDAAEATTGNVCHAVMRDIVDRWKAGFEWGDAIAQAINEAAEQGLDKWSQRLCQQAAEWLRDLIRKEEIEADNVLVEHRLAGEHFGLAGGGTADVVLVAPRECVWVIDWKFGYLEQTQADENDQLQAYAGMAAETFTAPEAVVILYQAREAKTKRVTAAKFDAAALKANAAWTRQVTAAARKRDAATVAGYAQCKNCRALAFCPTARHYLDEQRERMDVILPESPEEFGELAGAAKLASKFHKAGEEIVKARLAIDPRGATGWKLAPSGDSTLIDPAEALRIAHDLDRLAELMPFATFKPAAAEALEWLAPAVTTNPKAPSLKPDKGAA